MYFMQRFHKNQKGTVDNHELVVYSCMTRVCLEEERKWKGIGLSVAM
jgi:hypothetical protein